MVTQKSCPKKWVDLVDAADLLFRERGYHNTTLKDIAEKAGVPLGNVYYYFKTKSALCLAVVDKRQSQVSNMLELCLCQGNPQQSLVRLLKSIASNSGEFARFGCPLVSLSRDMGTEAPELKQAADSSIKTIMGWVAARFSEMGVNRPWDIAFDLVARMQGIIMLGRVEGKPKLIEESYSRTMAWLGQLSAQHINKKYAA